MSLIYSAREVNFQAELTTKKHCENPCQSYTFDGEVKPEGQPEFLLGISLRSSLFLAVSLGKTVN